MATASTIATITLLTASLLWLTTWHQTKNPLLTQSTTMRNQPYWHHQITDNTPETVNHIYVAYVTVTNKTRWLHNADRPYGKLSLLYIAAIILSGCGDIETNPGPTPQYPCAVCTDEVTFEQKAICCDACDQWTHTNCVGMNTTVYRWLENTDVMWFCPNSGCEIPNYSAVFSNPPMINSTDNRFSILATTTNSSEANTNPPNISSLAIDTPQKSPHQIRNLQNLSQTSNRSSPGIPLATSSPTTKDPKMHTSSPISSIDLSSNVLSNLDETHPKTHTSSSIASINLSSNASSTIDEIHPQRRRRKDNIKISVINFQSIKNKVPEFETFTTICQPDVVIGTESWLTPDIENSEIFPEEYVTFRKDRTDKKGGGVLISVNKTYVSSEVTIENNNCELIFVRIQLKDQKDLIVGSFYRPDWTDDEYMESFIKAVEGIRSQYKDHTVWIGGDFNLGDINWDTHTVTSSCRQPKLSQSLLDLTEDESLTQVVDIPTRNERILDLFLTTNPTLVNQVKTLPPLTPVMDHNIVFVDVDTRAAIQPKAAKKVYIYKKADWQAMREDMKDFKLPEGNTQEQWDSYEAQMHKVVDDHVPSRKAKSSRQKPWVTKKVKEALNRRDRAYKKWRKSRAEKDRAKFCKRRSQAQATLRTAHREYTESILNLDLLKQDDYIDTTRDKQSVSKRFWGYVKSKRKDATGVAPLRSNGVLIPDAKGKADTLNKQYASVFTKDEDDAPSKGVSPHPVIENLNITEAGVTKLLKGLNPNKASGPDKISPKVLNELAEEVSPHLTSIFNTSLETGRIPHQWKTALVAPIFKKGDRHSAANYRPVSLTSICCKVCEHIIARAIMQHLEDNGLLTDSQHGFRAKRSCETQLIS